MMLLMLLRYFFTYMLRYARLSIWSFTAASDGYQWLSRCWRARLLMLALRYARRDDAAAR